VAIVGAAQAENPADAKEMVDVALVVATV